MLRAKNYQNLLMFHSYSKNKQWHVFFCDTDTLRCVQKSITDIFDCNLKKTI